MNVDHPAVPNVYNLPGGYRKDKDRSEEATERRHHALMLHLAKKFTENAPTIQMPFSLESLEERKESMASMREECERLRGIEPQVMSAIFVDNTGRPILAYCSHRPDSPAPRTKPYDKDNQYEGRTQADMEAMKALGSTFSFDGLMHNQQQRYYLAGQGLCARTRFHSHKDQKRHEKKDYVTYGKEINGKDDADMMEMEGVETSLIPSEDEEEITYWHRGMDAEGKGVVPRKEAAGVLHLVHGWIQQAQAEKGLYISTDITKTGQSILAAKKIFQDTRPICIKVDALLGQVFPEWHRKYRQVFDVGVVFSEDFGPYLGRAVIYKLQGRLHRDNRDAGPSVSFGCGYYEGGHMIVPQLGAKFRYAPGEMCLFFSGYVAHLVDHYMPKIQTIEMQELSITPGRLGTVFFCPEKSLETLTNKPAGWGVLTGFGSNQASGKPSYMFWE